MLTPAQVARVNAIIGDPGTPRRIATRGSGFWIRHSPTTCEPTQVELFQKNEQGKVIRRWQIWPVEEGES